MRFGISTHLFHDQRLNRNHLAQIAAHGFEDIEIFATRTHFDYHDPAAIKELGGWLKETGLTLHSIHAPIVDGLHGKDMWGDAISNAVGDPGKRQAAVREADASMNIARELGCSMSSVSYHLSANQKEKSRLRMRKFRERQQQKTISTINL